MELKGERVLPAPRERVWAALNDPAILAQAIPGCEGIERAGDAAYAVTVAAAVGPVRARFRGRLQLEDVAAPERYTLRFDGQGGAAGFAKGESRVALADEGPQTRLTYTATAHVGGRLAQVGNRLVDSAALKIADEFFARFEPLVAAPEVGSEAPRVAGEEAAISEPPQVVATSSLGFRIVVSLIATAVALAVMLMLR